MKEGKKGGDIGDEGGGSGEKGEEKGRGGGVRGTKKTAIIHVQVYCIIYVKARF